MEGEVGVHKIRERDTISMVIIRREIVFGFFPSYFFSCVIDNRGGGNTSLI